ncbi:CtsR family transcriptional regulator [Thermoflavimicrobium daqui]|jgi:transcriptional regulator CtsR|uniref:Transcriptional regulator CtsR n=1 Tax=Thermoflavimicrobium daqui TaxID=2137476 RepID=A0A364K2Z7_9BACL|nr:CtsR family transcriptional regulator [Thermoflavimicrobium daqui]RAL23215.1 transcriptional regulator [Thermoflavimicrobium daqui]
MSSISDIIELYLKQILSESDSGVVEIKRSELADIFQCVPSQINYVISTRFTIEKGYIVESKRGGGGFIRIKRVPLHPKQANLFEVLLEQIGHSISQVTAEHIISRLIENGLMTEREALLMRHLISRETLQLPIRFRDELRARMMRMMVTILFASKGE